MSKRSLNCQEGFIRCVFVPTWTRNSLKSLHEVKQEELTSLGIVFLVSRGLNTFCRLLTHYEYEGVVYFSILGIKCSCTRNDPELILSDCNFSFGYSMVIWWIECVVLNWLTSFIKVFIPDGWEMGWNKGEIDALKVSRQTWTCDIVVHGRGSSAISFRCCSIHQQFW